MQSQTRDVHNNNSQHYSQHHSFDINLAAKYSVPEALLIHHFIFWISYNKRLNRNFKEGKWWTYQTQDEIAAHMPYYNRKQIMRILDKLVGRGIIIKGNFNKSTIDHTTWYAFVDESFLNNLYECPETDNRLPENGQTVSKNGQSIPDTKTTDTKKTTTTTPITQEIPEKVVAVFLDELPLSKEEKDSFASQFNEDQLKHMVAYYKGRISIAPDFVPDSWASYLANATINGYAIPQKSKPAEVKPPIDEKKNEKRANDAIDHLSKILKEGEQLYLTSLALNYRNTKGKIMVIYFKNQEFDQELNELYKIIKNTR